MPNQEVQATSKTADATRAAAPSQQFSFSDKLAAEGDLLASLPGTICGGIVKSAEEAWNNKGMTAFEIASGVALGAVFTLLTRNPNPNVARTTLWLGRAAMGVAAADLGFRFGAPMTDVWGNPNNLEKDKITLGENVGDAVFNYGLAVVSGGVGAKLGEQFVAPTKFGAYLQGFEQKTVNVPTREFINPEATATTESQDPLSRFARAFKTNAAIDKSSGLQEFADHKVTIRIMPDGSQIGSTSLGTLVDTGDGTSLWFKNQRSMLGLRNNLQLERVVHPDGSWNSMDASGAVVKPVVRPSGGLGSKVAEGSFKNLQTGNLVGSDGSRLVTNADHSVVEIDTASSRIFKAPTGDWNFDLLDKPKLTAINLDKLADPIEPYREGALAGLGEMMMERGADAGLGIIEHRILKSKSG